MVDSPTFTETFTVTTENPLLRGHLVHGRNILPGVGYVDLVLQVLARHGHAMATVELRNLAILAPLVAAPGEQVMVTVDGRPGPEDGWRIEVRSRRQDTVDVLHAVVTAYRHGSNAFQERMSVPLDGVDRLTPLTDIYAWLRDHELVHSGLMKIDGVVHHRAGDWVVELELPQAHRAGADRFLFHPALFEAGLLGGSVESHMLHDTAGDTALFLPLVIESFRAAAPLGEQCFVRVAAASASRDDELIRLVAEFYDTTGVKVAEVGPVVAKRIRDVAALDVREAAVPSAAVSRVPDTEGGLDVVAVLREMAAAHLGVPAAEVAANTGYYELGLTSAALVGLVTQLNDRYRLDLSPTVVFEHTTIADLAAWLKARLPETGGREHPRPAATAHTGVPPDRIAVVAAEVGSEIATLLNLPADAVDPDSELTELGFDMVSRSVFVERLNDRYGLSLTPAMLTAYPAVRDLAAYLTARHGDRPRPHPMLHRRVSIDDGTAYETHFDGSESYLRDHQVHGSRVLPGVVHLEMARAAVASSLDAPPGHAVRLQDVVWLRPATWGPDGLDLRVVVRQAGGHMDFEIRALGENEILCCQGRARRPDDTERPLSGLDQARDVCVGEDIPAARLYELCARAGLDYGPAQRSVTSLRTGLDPAGRRQVLAELRLPSTTDALTECVLHPAMLDGALQATAGLWLVDEGREIRSSGPALPFAVACVDVRGATADRAFAWVRYQPGSGPDAAHPRLDVTVFDENGRACAELTGLSTRASREPAGDTSQEPVSRATPADSDVDIAIVGVSGRYPDAADLDEFWENLRSGRDSVRRIPADRWERPEWMDEVGDRWGGFLDGIELFDPLFFQISVREAEHLDPHERLFLECAHHVLEDAGYTGQLLNRTSGKVGVFTGVMYQDYQLYGAQAQHQGRPVALSGSASSVANRVSYFYGFTGPSMSVDTMCSSSLTAIHLACEAIRSGRCGAALAGGVNLTSHPNKYLMLHQRNYLSSDGRCRSFGDGGDGYVPGEGVGAVLLKPLARAIADGDHVHAVIKGTAVNHGGRTPGYTVPSPVAQSQVVGEALAASGVDPRTVGYIEAHGTGTSLGDPIEVAGLARAFQEAGRVPERCAIGSVKSNIGHAESAAGIAGLTKVLLQMRHRRLVPSLHSGTLNPHIDFDGTGLRVQQDLEPWHQPTVEGRAFPRVASVSSFGAGGSNAHIVLTEYEMPAEPPRPAGGPVLLVLSAMTEAQLVEQARRLRSRLAELAEQDLPGVAWTLQTGRMALRERLAFTADSLAQARDVLAQFAAGSDRPGGWVRGTVLKDVTTGEAELARAVHDWSQNGAADRLLRMWAEGTEVPWANVRASRGADRTGGPESRPRRVPLPGYPFARERCWIELDAGASEEQPAPSVIPPDGEVVLVRPGWVAEEAPLGAAQASEFSAHHLAVVGTLTTAEREVLRTALPAGIDCRFVELVDGPVDRQYTAAARDVLGHVQEVLRPGLPRPVLFQVVLVGPAAGPDRERLACLNGLSGLLRTAGQENPHLHTQLVDCLDGASAATTAARLAAEARQGSGRIVRFRDGRRYTTVLDEMAGHGEAAMPWRDNGVYLITGGAGVLGRAVAGDIAAAVRHATVILVGRSALGDEQQAALERLRATGLTVEHRRADVGDRTAVARLLSDVTGVHGPLTGVLHGAGVIEDRLTVRKTAAELERVLAPKVAGLVHLDELSRDQPLEIFACMSSASGLFGNLGQADYAAANAFMDAYAGYRNHLVAAGERQGWTVSVGWPLWADGGMDTDEAATARLRDQGLVPLDTGRGLAALRRALTDRSRTGDGRLFVFSGRRSALSGLISRETGPAATSTPPTDIPEPPGDGSQALRERAVGYLRRLFGEILKLAPRRLHPDEELERYGMDSLLAVTAATRLEEAFGPLARTLVLERPTLRDLAEYFVTEHPSALRAVLGESGSAPATPPELPVLGGHTAPGSQRVAFRATTSRGEGMDVAVIGIAGRYPQSEDLDTLWTHLRDGMDCVTEPPAGRWDAAHRSGVWGGFLDGVDMFDAALFGMSPREAVVTDPQQRLFLETVWELLERGGVTQEEIEQRYERRVGVYVGAAYQMYRADDSDPTAAALTSTASYSLIANRVSQFFGLEGPSLAVDSMCTSSTMAIHLACADLRLGESQLAVAGGVNLAVHPDKFVALAEMQMLGSHPGSRSFRDGDGYLPAEAVGAVLLKPLAAALRDGDAVHAVIKGTASLHSGRANGFLTPSRKAQVTVMRRALEQAGVTPDSIGYVESSANGTALSDEVELNALREVFDGAAGPVVVGSVKSNLGHPEAATGVAQLTKVALQFRHRQIAPLTTVGQPNPNLAVQHGPLMLCEQLTPWEERPDDEGKPVARRALINSVAAGGSHVSLVVEAPPELAGEPAEPADAGPQLVVVSAGNPTRLRIAVRQLTEFLSREAVSLADVAYTLQSGREAMPERLAVVVGGTEELIDVLTAYLNETDGTAVHTGNAEDKTSPLLAVLDGARGESFLAALVADRDLERLAELWVSGIRIPWHGLHARRRRLVPLPGTAFQRESYWLGRTTHSQPAAVRRESAAPQPDGTEHIVITACAELLGYRPDELAADDSFLALGGHSLLAHRFATLLRERGVNCDVSRILRARSLAAIAEAARPAPAEHVTTPARGEPAVTAEKLPLISLTDEQMAAVVAAIPGGAANLQDIYPLAQMQEGMFFHHVKEGAHDPYVSSGLFSFADRDCLDRFAQALRATIRRHDALRTVILSEGLGGPVQVVLRHAELTVDELELRPGTPAAQQLGELLREAPHLPLDQAPLIRLRAGQHPGTAEWYAALTLHNTIHDASSLNLLFTEIVAQMEGRADTLPDPVPYRAYIEHSQRRGEDLDPGALFTRLLGAVSEPAVVFGLNDVHGDGQQVLEVRRSLDEGLGRRVRALAAELRTSPATLFHAGWALTVAACSGRDDAVFGTVMSGRLQGPAGVERMLGSFVNTLPVRLDLTGRDVRELVRQTEEVLHELVGYEQITLTEARTYSGLPSPEVPLFNAILNYRHLPGDDESDRLLERVGITPLSDVIERTNYPVTVSVDDLGDAFRITAQIHRDQDAGVVAETLEAAMAALVDALSEQDGSGRQALELSVLSPAMRRREVAEFAWEPVTADGADARAKTLVHHWFEEVVRADPDAVAVRCADRSLTYGELNTRANRLARYLRGLGVGRDSLVALCLPRGEWLVICALAVVKAGGAYVPVDPSAPAERLGHVLSDSGPRVLLVDGEVPAGLSAGEAEVVDVPAATDRWAALPGDDLEPLAGACPADLAYVIYTSGSTGLPKGVQVEHGHVARFFVAQEWFDYRPGDVWTLFHSFAFDFTVWEMWGALLHRGTLVVVTQEVARSPRDFYRLLCQEGVTILGQTPTGFGQLIEAQGDGGAPHRIRTVVLGGEELDASTLGPWFARPVNDGTELVNMWGTTETGVVTTYRLVTEADTNLTTRPIGGPMPGLGVYVLDRRQQPVPTGAVGELVIGGDAMARGYLNRPELTAERFLTDSFRGVPGARMYRTGDLGRRLPDGSLEFLGRNDDQVKIRGYRIELGEISTRLNEHPAVADARVVVRGQGDDRRLVGYVVASARQARPVRELARLARTEPGVLERVHELPNGLPVFHRDVAETESHYWDVFTGQGYLRHGITLGEGDHVVDAGAHIGLFTLFAGLSCPAVKLYASEPDPTALGLLRRNVALHGLDAEVLGLDLSEVMTRQDVERIDLLRIDAQSAEYDVLRGIADADWRRVRQVVADIADIDGRLKNVVVLLEEKGFDVVSEQERVYARRPASAGRENALPCTASSPRWPNERVLKEDLDATLRAVLPSYMVPSAYVVLDELPLTSNGKLDHRALPEPEVKRRADELGDSPRTDAERIVSEVWAELLGTEAGHLGLESNFFSLGGNSLLVTRMINMIKQRTGVELRVQTVFNAERLTELAAEVARGLPDPGTAPALDLDAISQSVSLVESLTDAELDALDIADADTGTPDITSQAGKGRR